MSNEMNNSFKEFGEVFRNLRKAKKFTLAETSGDIISQSQLARFERGDSRISADVFFRVLESINVSADEFQATLNNYNSTKDIFLSTYEINQAYLAKNQYKLDLLLQSIEKQIDLKPGRSKSRLDKIVVEAAISLVDPAKTIPQKDLDFLRDYLRGIEIWGEYEIRLMQWTTHSFDPYTLATLTATMLAPVHSGTRTYYRDVYLDQTVLNVINAFLEKGELNLAQRYIDYLDEKGINEYHLNERLTLLCHRTRLAWKRGDKSALEQHRKNLEIFNYCGCYQLAKMVGDEITEMEAEKLKSRKRAI